MKFLPENVLSGSLSAVDARKLDYFYEQFVILNSDVYGKGHFVLACYAALPAVLTPDLIYKIWLNFKNYSLNGDAAVIHPVAPADILLSPLVEEIGSELYEMPEQIRKVLLLYLKDFTTPGKNEMQLFGLEKIAEFLKDYISYDFTPENKDDDAFKEAQEWTAQSYINPGKAFSEVAQAFQQSKTNAGRARYKDAIEKMSARFALNIVKDEAAIPKDFKAMTALTSVVRDVLNDGDSEGLHQLREEALKTKDLLTSVPIKAPNVINIEIPEKVGKKIIDAQIPVPKNTGVLKALIVGVTTQNANTDQNNADEKSAELIYNTIAAAVGDNQRELNLVIGEKATRAAILNAWKELLSDIHQQDNLLFYFAANALTREGHCRAICAESETRYSDEGPYITDEEIGDLTRDVNCASITFILQLDYASTPYWLDISKPQNTIFASCKYNQPAVFSHKETDEGTYCMFTYCLADTIRKKGIQFSNRHLFAETMISYENNESLNTSQLKTPQLLCPPGNYDRFFLNGNGNTAILQNLLRQAAFCSEKTTGSWNSLTAYALDHYCEETGIPKNLSKQDYINNLLEYKETKAGKELPIFLLLFCDPQKKLPAILDERRFILEALQPINNLIELIILDDPNKIKLEKVLTDKNNRNRVELFHYSGMDDNGNMILKDGTLHIAELAAMLDYQECIKLFFANTCRSQVLASHLTQIGVANAIGVSGIVDDNYAAEFAREVFLFIGSKKNVEEHSLDLFEVGSNRADSGNKDYILFKAGWQSADAKLIWDLNSVSAKVEIFCLIIAFDQYRSIGNLSGSVNDAMFFASWMKEQTKEENCRIITQVGNQHDIDNVIEQIFSLAEKSDSIEKKLILYVNGRGVNGANPVFYLPEISETRRNSALDLEAYISTITSSGVFDKVILFYELLNTPMPGVQGLHPLFQPKNSLLKSESVSIGFFSPSDASIEKNMNMPDRVSFTNNLLHGLSGAASNEEGNVTSQSLNNFMKSMQPTAVTVYRGSTDFIIVKGKPLPLFSVLIKFADQHSGKTFNLSDEKSNIIDSVILNQSTLEFELKAGIYVAKIPEAGVHKIFAVKASADQIVIDISWAFRNKWIGIIGSGDDLTQEEINTAKAIGSFLAEQGYGVVTGGWPGVDYLTGESYHNALSSNGVENADNYLLQIVRTGQDPDFKKGQILQVDEKLWEETMIQKCATFISIGGRGYTYQMYKRTQKLSHPFIPLAHTGGDSSRIFQKILETKQSIISQSLLDQLGMLKATNESCINLLKEILDEINNGSNKKGQIFLSYSQNDLEYVTRLADDLKHNNEIVFFAARTLKENADYSTQKQEALLESEFVVFVISKSAVASRHVTKEMNTAIEEGKKIIGIIIDKSQVPDSLRIYPLVDMQADYEKGMRRVLQVINPQTPDPAYSEKEIEAFYANEMKRIAERFKLSSKNEEDLQFVIENEFIADDSRILVPKNKFLDILINKGIKQGDEIINALSQSRIIKRSVLHETEILELAHDLLVKAVKEASHRTEKTEAIFDADGFYTNYGIRNLVKKSGEQNESNVEINTLLIYKTSKQHTWLAISLLRTYIILDDANTRAKERLIQTSFDKSKTLPLEFRDSIKGKGKVVRFSAQDTWWYYSVKLFSNPENLVDVLEKIMITILWVDDNPDNNVTERDTLTKLGFKFDMALSTSDAMEKLKLNKYCAIISDMARADGNAEGYVLLEKVRESNSLTPFFIYAGSNSPEQREEASKRGAQGVTNNIHELTGLIIEHFPNLNLS